MSVPIEAQSLSTLTNLFANPPQYPRNPTHRVHEPLVLYIVRVPGSKDIFLSPIKPPTKVSVSIEAIQSSLYYLHVPTPEDEEVTKAVEEEERESQESSRPSITIARKPLPSSAKSHPLPPIPQEPPYQPYRPNYGNSNTKPAATGPLRLDTGPDFETHRKYFTSDPQPPSLFEPAGDYAISSPTIDNYSPYQDSISSARSSPPKGYNPSLQRNPSPPLHQQQPVNLLNVARRTDPKFPPITIIRRDPTSGSQWNIGTITVLNPTFTGSPLQPVHVELDTPGYRRFTRMDYTPRRRGSGASDATSVRRAIESLATSPASATTPDSPAQPFVRTVDFRKMALSDLRRTIYQRTNSSDSIGRTPNESSRSGIEKNVLAFDSPWGGTCTFVNAIDGKTLKLKHTIQTSVSTTPDSNSNTASLAELRFNLGWSVLGNVKTPRVRSEEPDKLPIPRLLESKKENFRRSFQQLKNKSRESFQRSKSNNSVYDDYTAHGHNEQVLRDLSNIDTPTTNNLSTPVSAQPQSIYPSRQRDKTYLSAPSSAQPTSSENEEDDHRISLKLGRERAGGGFRGHSAKLGKLVIEDEGLKMCDLVVSAAMGVWWQHYGA